MISAPLTWKTDEADYVESPNRVASSEVVYHEKYLEKLEHHRALGSPLLSIDLHPVEKNFFLGMQGTRATKLMVIEYYERCEEQGELKAIDWLNSQFQSLSAYSELKRHSSSVLSFIDVSTERIKFHQGRHYDYYQELVSQYKTIKDQQPDYSKWMYTVQGLHSLGTGYPEDDFLRDGETPRNASMANLRNRIRQLKGEAPIEETSDYWEHTPFAIALAGNFHNTFCGHASSLPEISKLIYDQRNGKDLGFLKDATYDIIRELLGLDSEMKMTGAKRILIDVRHMSPAARKLYYHNIIAVFNEIPANRDHKIPIIATNVGFSGIDSLDEMIRNAAEGKEKDNFRSKGFLAWGYNLSDEDVIAIFHSRGLINLANDTRLLGEDHQNWLSLIGFKTLTRKRAHQLVKRNIEQIVRISFDYFLSDPLKIWDIISFYPSASPTSTLSSNLAIAWDNIEEDLLSILVSMKREEPLWFGNYRPEDLVQKICYGNAERVLKSLE